MRNKKHCVPTYIYSHSFYKNVEFFRKKIKKNTKLEKKNNAEYSNGMYNTPLTDTQILLDVLNSAAAWAYGKSVVPLNAQNICSAARCSTKERGGVSIQDIALKIASCSRCVLAQTRTKTVPGFGCLKPLVMVIGEGPGADEDRSGLPLSAT